MNIISPNNPPDKIPDPVELKSNETNKPQRSVSSSKIGPPTTEHSPLQVDLSQLKSPQTVKWKSLWEYQKETKVENPQKPQNFIRKVANTILKKNQPTRYSEYKISKNLEPTQEILENQFPAVEMTGQNVYNLVEKGELQHENRTDEKYIVYFTFLNPGTGGLKKLFTLEENNLLDQTPLKMLGIKVEDQGDAYILKIPDNKTMKENWKKIKESLKYFSDYFTYLDSNNLLRKDITVEEKDEALKNLTSWSDNLPDELPIQSSEGIEDHMDFVKAFLNGKMIIANSGKNSERIHDITQHIVYLVNNQILIALDPQFREIDRRFKEDIQSRYDQIVYIKNNLSKLSTDERSFFEKQIPLMEAYLGSIIDDHTNSTYIESPFVTYDYDTKKFTYKENIIRNEFEDPNNLIWQQRGSKWPIFYKREFPERFANEDISNQTAKDLAKAWKRGEELLATSQQKQAA